MARCLRFYGDGISFRVVFSQSFWLRVLPEWCTPCSVKMDDSEKDSERWLDMWCLLLTFPELFQLVGLISSVFLSRTSCCKTTYANGYYVAWPGWAVSISVLPLTFAAHQAFIFFTISWSLLKLMSFESVMSSNHHILCRLLLLLPSIFLSIRVFSRESAFLIRCPKYWSFTFSISPSNEYSGLISFRMD